MHEIKFTEKTPLIINESLNDNSDFYITASYIYDPLLIPEYTDVWEIEEVILPGD